MCDAKYNDVTSHFFSHCGVKLVIQTQIKKEDKVRWFVN